MVPAQPMVWGWLVFDTTRYKLESPGVLATFHYCDKIRIKTNLERVCLASISQSIIKESQGRILEAGTKAWTVGECCLLVCFSDPLSVLSLIYFF